MLTEHQDSHLYDIISVFSESAQYLSDRIWQGIKDPVTYNLVVQKPELNHALSDIDKLRKEQRLEIFCEHLGVSLSSEESTEEQILTAVVAYWVDNAVLVFLEGK